MAVNKTNSTEAPFISRWKAIFYKLLSNVDPSMYMALLMGMLVVVIVTPRVPSPTLRWVNDQIDMGPFSFVGIPEWIMVAALVGFSFFILRYRPLPFETFMFSVPAGIFGLMTIAYAISQHYTYDVIVWIIFGYVAIFIMNFSVMSAQNYERENKLLKEQNSAIASEAHSRQIEIQSLSQQLEELKLKLEMVNQEAQG